MSYFPAPVSNGEVEQLLDQIRIQLDYYFSPSNLLNDFFMQAQMDFQGFIPIPVLSEFNRLKRLAGFYSAQQLIIQALLSRPGIYCEISPDLSKVGPKRYYSFAFALTEVDESIQEQSILDLLQNINVSSLVRDFSGNWVIQFESELEARTAIPILNQSMSVTVLNYPLNKDTFQQEENSFNYQEIENFNINMASSGEYNPTLSTESPFAKVRPRFTRPTIRKDDRARDDMRHKSWKKGNAFKPRVNKPATYFNGIQNLDFPSLPGQADSNGTKVEALPSSDSITWAEKLLESKPQAVPAQTKPVAVIPKVVEPKPAKLIEPSAYTKTDSSQSYNSPTSFAAILGKQQ